MKTRLDTLMFVILSTSLAVTACRPARPASGGNGTGAQATPTAATTDSTMQSSQKGTATPSSSNSNDAPHVDVLDTTHLTLGDHKTSTSPQKGYVFACQTQFNGGGAQHTGSWINSDGKTWDSTKKIYVNGSVDWPSSFTMTVEGDQRVFTSNDLPDHPTGTFPISPSDPAYQIDRNPNSIQAQNISFSVPANPTVAAQPTCVGGEVGIMTSGVLIFSAFDAGGRDAVAHEVQDHCDGHPQQGGFYHYHSLSSCIQDSSAGPSKLLGYAFDGFGIYGPYDENGRELTDADLDECHGITSEVEWNGQKVMMYHYVATREFPYVVGCFRGTPSVKALTAPNSGRGGNGQQQGTGNGNTGPQGGAGQANGQPDGIAQPPQAAIDACANLTQGATCTVNGQVSGTCRTPPNNRQLACIPANGQP